MANPKMVIATSKASINPSTLTLGNKTEKKHDPFTIPGITSVADIVTAIAKDQQNAKEWQKRIRASIGLTEQKVAAFARTIETLDERMTRRIDRVLVKRMNTVHVRKICGSLEYCYDGWTYSNKNALCIEIVNSIIDYVKAEDAERDALDARYRAEEKAAAEKERREAEEADEKANPFGATTNVKLTWGWFNNVLNGLHAKGMDAGTHKEAFKTFIVRSLGCRTKDVIVNQRNAFADVEVTIYTTKSHTTADGSPNLKVFTCRG